MTIRFKDDSKTYLMVQFHEFFFGHSYLTFNITFGMLRRKILNQLHTIRNTSMVRKKLLKSPCVVTYREVCLFEVLLAGASSGGAILVRVTTTAAI